MISLLIRWELQVLVSRGKSKRPKVLELAMSLVEAINFSSRLPGLRVPERLQRWVSPLVLLALWELGSRVGIIPTHVLAAPTAVLQTIWQMLSSGELPINMLVSLGRAMAGLAIGVSVEGRS